MAADNRGAAVAFPKPRKKKGNKRSRVIDPLAIEAARKPYCQHCGITGCWISVHHIVYRSQGGGDVPENLISLCDGPGSNQCHGQAHAKKLTKDDLRSDLRADHERQSEYERIKKPPAD